LDGTRGIGTKKSTAKTILEGIEWGKCIQVLKKGKGLGHGLGGKGEMPLVPQIHILNERGNLGKKCQITFPDGYIILVEKYILILRINKGIIKGSRGFSGRVEFLKGRRGGRPESWGMHGPGRT